LKTEMVSRIRSLINRESSAINTFIFLIISLLTTS
jgi:hypothetical protein